MLLGCFVLFCLRAPHDINKCLNFHDLPEQEKIGQHSLSKCFKIGHGHSYEAFILFDRYISILLFS